MLALLVKVPKIQRRKALKIDVFNCPTVVWCPLSREPQRVYPHKSYIARNYRVIGIIESLVYVITAHSVGLYLHSDFRCRLRRACFVQGVRNGRSRSSNVIDFWYRSKTHMLLLVISSISLVLRCPVSEILQVFCWEQRSHPYFIWILGCFHWTRLQMSGFRQRRP